MYLFKKQILLAFGLSLILSACGGGGGDGDGSSAPAVQWYPDADSDGFGDASATVFVGDQPDATYVKDNTDCDDNNNAINPDATESGTADLIDTDCDGDVDPGFKYVFVTSTNHLGDLTATAPNDPATNLPYTDGLAAGDAICQSLADNAPNPLPGTYIAWLSSSTVDAVDRFGVISGPPNTYVLADVGRSVVSTDFAGLIDGFIDILIGVDETGTPNTSEFSWTGTAADGRADVDVQNGMCTDWTNGSLVGSGSAAVGRPTEFNGLPSNGLWTESGAYGACGLVAPIPIYCFQL